METTFAKLGSADLVEIQSIVDSILDSEKIGFSWDNKKIQTEFSQAIFYGYRSQIGGLLTFIALRTVVERSDASGGGVFEITVLAAKRDQWGRGLMRRLLAETIDTLAPEEIWLEVHEGNLRARNLYEKEGFIQVGIRPSYYADGGAAVLYSLTR